MRIWQTRAGVTEAQLEDRPLIRAYGDGARLELNGEGIEWVITLTRDDCECIAELIGCIAAQWPPYDTEDDI
jgi:hypothetical protein